MDWLRNKKGPVARPPSTLILEPPRPFAAYKPRPLSPIPETPRPTTASLKSPSFASSSSTLHKAESWTSLHKAETWPSLHKPTKYGTGKYADVELVPQPSDDENDPLNWPRWRKDLNLASLLFTVGLVGAMKTAFITTNSVMTVRYNVSYTAVAALTAVPLIISSFTGFASAIAAKLWGKRPVYLASFALLFAGSLWNMTADSNYLSCMGARVLQGLGWGAFDILVLGSVQDTYFEHERSLRVSIYNMLTIASTWGSPLLGGVASSNADTFALQFRVINALYFVAIPLLFLGAPETAFDRAGASTAPSTPATPVWRPWRFRHRYNKDNTIAYLKEIVTFDYRGQLSLSTALQVPRALFAPTTVLVFLISFVPHCALWGITASVALLFSPLPFSLTPSVIGTLMVGPWILATAVVAGLCFYRGFHDKFTSRITQLTVGVGSSLALIGLLTFGVAVCNFLKDGVPGSRSAFISEAPSQLSLPLISFQLGLLAAGTNVLDAVTRPLLARSASFTSPSMAVAQRSIGDMHSGVTVLRDLVAGIFILTVPNTVSLLGGLKSLIIGLGVTQVGLAAGIVALWHFREEAIWRADGRLMGLVDLSLLKESVSFFDPD